MLTVPYVTAAEFRAHPTFLDTQNLRTGANQVAQDAALTNALLVASQWADDELDMPLAAHRRVEQTRVRPDRSGRLRYHPEHAPVLAVVSASTGPTPGALTASAGSTWWLEQDGRLIVGFLGGPGPGLAALQFGAPAPVDAELLVQWTYLAGWPHTQLATAAAAGETTLAVADAIGIAAGTVLRLWTPAAEEAVTVTAVAGSTLTLAAPLARAHPLGMSCSALPATARQAVITYAAAELLRPAPAAQERPAPGAPATSSTSGDPQRVSGGAGLRAQACRLLASFRRIR